MTLTPNYDPSPLHPRVIITNGVTTYTFESKQLYVSPTQDFKLNSFQLHYGINDDFGTLVMVIHDHNGIFTDTNTLERSSTIGREWSVQFYLGKTVAGLSRWFYGKIKEVANERPSTNLQMITITAVGWGIILRERMSRMIRNQKKESDGETLDDTDTNTQIDQLILDVFNDTDHYIDSNITQIGNITATSTTDGSGVCSDCGGNTKIANVNFTIASFAQIISNLAGVANTNWMVDYDRKLVVHDPNVHDSGFLFTNNLSASRAQNWNSTKIGYILNSPIRWSDSSADTYYSMLHGYGHFTPALEASDGQTPNASFNLDTKYFAIPFTTPSDNIFKIAIRSTKTGTPATDGKVEIWGDTAGSGPDEGDVRRSILLNKKTLQALGTSTPSNWFEIPIKPKLEVNPNEQLYIVFIKFGDASNTFNVDYKTGSGTYWDSTDGTTWTSRTGTPAYRVYSAKRLLTTLENTETRRLLSEPRERMFPIRADLEEQTVRQTMLAAGEVLGKQKRLYDRVIISPTTSRIPTNTFCIFEDAKTGLFVRGVIEGVDLSATSLEQGVQRIELELSSVRY